MPEAHEVVSEFLSAIYYVKASYNVFGTKETEVGYRLFI
jgi:hypothetical protein